MLIKLSNPNPSEAEKKLFLTAGYYCIDRGDGQFEPLKYVVLHFKKNPKTFPNQVEIEKKFIDYDSSIIFDTMTETVKITRYLDIDHISFVLERMNELGFKRILF